MTPFFIGWAGLPRSLNGFVASVVSVIGGIGAVFAALILIALPPRETGAWDAGDFEGVLVTKPYAMVRVPAAAGKAARSVLLVDEWKFGLELGSEYTDGQTVHVQGFALSRGDGIVLQVNRTPQRLDHTAASIPALRDAGEQILSGEIVDSKCWAGAMNPGDGKAHRGCGSLCLLGNIPALFITRAPDGAIRWYVLADADGNPLDEAIRLHIGEPLTLTGHVFDAADLHEFRIDQKSADSLLTFAAATAREGQSR